MASENRLTDILSCNQGIDIIKPSPHLVVGQVICNKARWLYKRWQNVLHKAAIFTFDRSGSKDNFNHGEVTTAALTRGFFLRYSQEDSSSHAVAVKD